MDAADLARWTRFAAKGGIGTARAVVDCVASEVGDLMFLKDDDITVLMQLPEHGFYLGYCEGVVGRFSGADVSIQGKLKKAVMAKRGSIGVLGNTGGGMSGSVTPGKNGGERQARSLSRSESGGAFASSTSVSRSPPAAMDMPSGVVAPPLETAAQTRDEPRIVHGSREHSLMSISASTSTSTTSTSTSTSLSIASSGLVPASISGLLASNSVAGLGLGSGGRYDEPPVPPPRTSSLASASSLASTASASSSYVHPSFVGDADNVGDGMKLRSAIEERDMDMRASESNPSFATSSSTSGTSFASASTHGSLASASTYGSLRTVSSQPDSIISSSTSGSESAASQSDSLISSSTSTSAFTSTSEFTAASTSASMTFANSSTSTLTPTAPLRLTKSPNVRPIDLAPAPSSSLPTRSPLPSFSPLRPAHPPVSHQEHDQDLNHENHDQESRLYTSSPTASDTTHSQHDYNQGNITEATAETSLYLTEHESTRLSTLEQHHLGLGEDDSEGEEDGEVGIGLSLLGALAMDDDDDDEMDARTRRSDGGQGIAHGKTSGAGAIPWTKYAPSPNKNMNGMEIPGGHTHESGADREYQGDDGHHANGRHEEQIDDEAEEEVEDEEGYWDRASDIYDDYRYSRYSMASALSKRISAMPGSKRVSTMSKSPLSGNKRASKMSVMTKGSGKSVPPMPSFSPDRPSFENRPSIESRADAPSVYSRPSVYSQVDRPSIYSQADESVYSRPSFEENQRPSFESQSPSQNNHSLASQVRPPFESRPSFESQRSATESQYSEDSHSDSHSQYSRSRSDSRSSTATLSPLTTQFPQPPVSRLRGELWPGAGAIGGGSEEVEGGGGKEQQSKGEKEAEGAGDISFVSQLTNPFDSHETKELACGTQQHDPPTPNPHDNLIQTPTGSTHTNTNPNNTFPISPLLHTSFGSPHSSASELGSRVTSGYTEDDGERHGEHNDDLNVDEHITPGKEGDLRADDSFTSTTLVPSSSSGTATPISTPTPPPVTTALRPRQPSSTQPHPFARTSIFLPHPNAPKAVGAGATSGPLYARPGQQSHPVSQVPNTKSEQHPGVPNPNIPLPKPGFPHLQPASLPNTTPFSIHVLHHIRGSTSAGGIMNPRTVYGRCEPDLAAAMGPVPILFSTNPLPPLPDVLGGVGLGIGGNHMETASVNAMNTGFGGLGDPGPTTVSPGFAAPPNVMGVPTRTMSAGPMGAPSSSFPPPAKAPAPARSSSAVATGGGASDSAPSRPVPRRAMTQDGSRGGLGGILSNRSGPSPDTNANPNANPSTSANIAIPRAGFVPQVGAARPRSRSFSAFGARAPVTNGMLNDIESKNREDSNSEGQTTRTQSTASFTRSTSTLTKSIDNVSGRPDALTPRHIPSPLSLQNSNLNPSLSTASSGYSASNSRFSGSIASISGASASSSLLASNPFKSPTSPLSQGASPLSSMTQFALQVPSNTQGPPGTPNSIVDRDKESSPMSVPSGSRSSVSSSNPRTGASPQPWIPPQRHATLDVPPRKNSLEPPRRQSSDSSDSRSQMTSPPPIGETYSQSARSSPLAHEMTLRSKLSLPVLRGKTTSRQRIDDAASITSSGPRGSMENVNETVQVQDMDFELVKPTLPQASGRASQDSSLATRDPPIFDSTKLDSPGLQPSGGDDASLLSSAPPKSPMSSTDPSAPAPESPTSMDAHRQRELKWMAILPSTPPSQARKSKKVKRLLLEGVPSSVRYLVWCHLTDSKARALPGVYAQLGKRPRVPAFADIGRSVKTCFPDQTQLHSPQGPLVSLLQAYLSMVPDIQYSSGLTAIAGHLLLLSPEEDAFWIFVSMMDAHLRPYFSANTIQVEVDSALLSKAIESNDAGVGKKMFVSLGILPSSICRPWFSTLFVGSLPVEFLHRIWDLFLYEGVTFLFRVGLALTQCVRHLLLQATSEEAALEYLAHPPLACLPSTADAFISQALSMKLKDDDVRKQRVKMEAQVKRQTQVRTLSTNGVSGMQTASISLPKS